MEERLREGNEVSIISVHADGGDTWGRELEPISALRVRPAVYYSPAT
jgi:hypothetical protein